MRTEKQRSYGSVEHILLRNKAAQFLVGALKGEQIYMSDTTLFHIWNSPDLAIDQGSEPLPVSQDMYLQHTLSHNS